MVTDPLKQRRGDPGRPEVCPLFALWKFVDRRDSTASRRDAAPANSAACKTRRGSPRSSTGISGPCANGCAIPERHGPGRRIVAKERRERATWRVAFSKTQARDEAYVDEAQEMSGGDTSDFTPDGLVIEGLREGILAALQRGDLDPEDRRSWKPRSRSRFRRADDARPAPAIHGGPSASAP